MSQHPGCVMVTTYSSGPSSTERESTGRMESYERRGLVSVAMQSPG